MVGLALREFECTLCRQGFTLTSGDLVVPQPRICDEYLKVLWNLESDALAQQLTTMLAEHPAPPGEPAGTHAEEQELTGSIVHLVHWERQRWNTLDDAIQARERDRHTSR